MDTLLPTQMFPRLPARATFVVDTNFVSGTQNVSDFVQKHFVSVTNVSQFAQPIIIDTIYACNSLYKENLWTYISRICE